MEAVVVPDPHPEGAWPAAWSLALERLIRAGDLAEWSTHVLLEHLLALVDAHNALQVRSIGDHPGLPGMLAVIESLAAELRGRGVKVTRLTEGMSRCEAALARAARPT